MKLSKRAQASRANGARSTGPKTLEGKLRSQTHAIRHGLLAQAVVLQGEDPEVFKALMADLEERFQPVGEVELAMIEEMAHAYWRMRRSWIIEAEMLNSGLRSRPGTFDVRLTATFTDPDTMPKLALLQRYETRLHRMYQRALNNLLTLREQKQKAEIAEQPKEAEVVQDEEVNTHLDKPPASPQAAWGAPCNRSQPPVTVPSPGRPPIAGDSPQKTPAA